MKSSGVHTFKNEFVWMFLGTDIQAWRSAGDSQPLWSSISLERSIREIIPKT